VKPFEPCSSQRRDEEEEKKPEEEAKEEEKSEGKWSINYRKLISTLRTISLSHLYALI
jgi:hypothetical protein